MVRRRLHLPTSIATLERTREPMQTAEEGAVRRNPRQHAVEFLAHGERADGYAQLEVIEGARGPAREVALAEQCVRVEVAKMEREHLVQQHKDRPARSGTLIAGTAPERTVAAHTG
jgi:hypothetical protein